MTAVSITFNAQLEVGPIKRRKTENRKRKDAAKKLIGVCTKAFLDEKQTLMPTKVSSQFHLLYKAQKKQMASAKQFEQEPYSRDK